MADLKFKFKREGLYPAVVELLEAEGDETAEFVEAYKTKLMKNSVPAIVCKHPATLGYTITCVMMEQLLKKFAKITAEEMHIIIQKNWRVLPDKIVAKSPFLCY